ncbi:hypothetical protein CMQ_360 [Grosmannia clavigera kw1407]|uniref:NADH-ubiquinone oxidoreductase B15 subunit n=1 Tax=Grosmannia clavigera (strain kw1407 / UAMH 11150) TaxID=655863 RepID=F0XF97_GROCL|nr:uncharacterized protein CMQ_360 [Grosmannia clavigera kw1407]EFX03432.1 hypothetical protein CMQ_360 [Grosmannia clavigera kw1407]
MAGLQHFKMDLDPSIVKLSNMTNNRYKYFRWTPRTAWLSFFYIGLVPSLLGVVAYKTEGKWNMRAKRRGDTISEF